jgi:hypothetical protein
VDVKTVSQSNTAGVAGAAAVILARVIVPLWLLTGAVLKLVDLSPTHLPVALIKWAGALGVDLVFVLRFGIAAELIVVGVMFVLPPLARWTGILMVGSFLPILVGDLMLGASSCGCFGAIEVNPWVTLVTDVTFFLGLLFLGRREPRLALTSSLPTSRVLAVGIWSLLSVVIAFAAPADTPAASSAIAGDHQPLPANGYYLPAYEEWIGQPFQELDIATWAIGLPDDLDVGQHFVIFFRKDCEHCHELLEVYFSGTLDWPTTAIAVPERDGWPTENLQPFTCHECRTAELPAGIDWFLQTPVLVRLMDGLVECAAEVDPMSPECLDW